MTTNSPSPSKVRCPACGSWVQWKNNPHRPFCTPDCKSRDLGNWATERYRIAGEPMDCAEEKKEEE